jgi:hypothetical protein
MKVNSFVGTPGASKGASGIHVAEYMTQLPPKELLQGKLHTAIERANEKYEVKEFNKLKI